MPAGAQLTTIGLFQAAQCNFYGAANQCFAGDINDGTASIAMGLWNLNKALLAELTQMSQDIAALKAEVAALKPQQTGLQMSSHALIRR